jgi:hypothetical protein
MAHAASSDTEFPVSILMERRPKQRDGWHFVEWKAVGVLPGREPAGQAPQQQVIYEDKDCQRILWTHFSIRLSKAGAESYWSNLIGEQPSLFVVCRRDEVDNEERPFLVTVDYEEIVRHQEVDDIVHSVPLFREIHQWLERYVVDNYVPTEPKRKRKRADYGEPSNVQAPPSERRH